jgi:hypothetical protein
MFDFLGKEINILTRILAGGLAGVIAWTVIYPTDVIRSRMMSEIDIQNPKYTGTLDCLQSAFKKEKLSWCYKVRLE